jgi:photosystem II stability/assembly factor-like uncharacterized protein
MDQGEFLFGIHVFDQSTIYVAGGRFKAGAPVGAFMRSTDLGATWTLLGDAPQTIFVDRVHFVDATSGYALGNGLGSGLVLKTTDAGQTWSRLHEPTGIMNSFYVHGRESITIVGSPGVISRTDDGGVTWEDQSSPITGDVYSVQYTSPDRGFIAGQYLLETTNGGSDWSAITTPVSTAFNDVAYMPENGTLIVVGAGGVILRGNETASVGRDKSLDWSVYPNPASDHLIAPAVGEIRIRNLTGVLLQRSRATQPGERISFDLPAGLYTIEIDRDGSASRTKLIVR